LILGDREFPEPRKVRVPGAEVVKIERHTHLSKLPQHLHRGSHVDERLLEDLET